MAANNDLVERSGELKRELVDYAMQRRFFWTRDGEALLRKHYASYNEHPVLPSIMPLSEHLLRARMTPPQPDRPRQKSGVRGK